MRDVKALDVKKFASECCTRVMTNGVPLVTHKVELRLIKSKASKISSVRDYFILKYVKSQNLIQPYIVAIREKNSFGTGENIAAYFRTLEAAEAYVEPK